MNSRRRIVVAVVIGAVIAAGVVAWRYIGGGGNGGSPGARAGSASATGSATTHANTRATAPAWFGVAAAGERRITGTVYVGTEPAAATLELRSVATDTGAMEPLAAGAGADGTFAITGLRAGSYRLHATAPGSVPGTVEVSCVGGDADHVEIFLPPCRAMVTGEVRDASGGPIVGATIETGGFPVATTDADGRYQLCLGAEPVLTARADGYAAATRSLGATGSLALDFDLVPEAILDVSVVDGGEHPVAGALVTAAAPVDQSRGFRFGGRDDDTMGRPLVAITGADGHATLRGVADAAVRLVATTGDLATATSELVEPVPGKTTAITLHVVATVAIHGAVVDADAKPIAGLALEWIAGEARRGDAVTAADGTFVIAQVPPGAGTFAVDPPDYVRSGAAYDAEPGAKPAELVAYHAETVSGRVLRAGKPVGGADVTWLSFGGAGVKSRADGAYALPRFAFQRGGTLEIQAVSQALGAFGTRKIELAKDLKSVTGIDVELEWGGSIAGVVVDQAGKPLAGVNVSYESKKLNDYGAGTTGADGAFVASQLRGGDAYVPTLRFEGSELAPVGADAWPGTDIGENGHITGVRLVAQVNRTTVEGIVVDRAGAAIADAVVRLIPAFRPGRSGADGRFRITTTHAGPFSVQARATGDRTGVTTDVAAGATNVRVVLGDPGKVHAICEAGVDEVQLFAKIGGAGRWIPLACGATVSVPAGAYQVSAGMFVDSEIVVKSGETTELHVAAPTVSQIEVAVLPPAGGAMPADLECALDVESKDGSRRVSMLGELENGVMHMALPYGSITARCTGSAGVSGTKTFEASTPSTHVEVQLVKAPS